MTSPPPPRFGFRNLAAFAGLAAWAYYAAVSEVDLGLPGASARALIEGLSWQALWFVPVGALSALALPRPRSLFYHLVFGFLPSAALGAVVVALIAQAPAEAPWRVLENPTAPPLLPLLAPLAGMVIGALIGLVLARGVGSALMLIPVLLAVGVVLVAIAAVALLLLTDRVAVAEPSSRPPADGALSARLHPGAGAAGISSLFQSALLLEDEELELAVSLPWDAPVLGERFFNFTATASPWIGATQFHAGLRTLSVGGVGLPQSGVQLASDLLSRWLTGDPLAMGGSGMAPVESVWMDGSRVLVRLAGEEAAEALAALAPSVSFYLDSLSGEAEAIRARRSRLAAAVGRAFALARGRSAEGGAVEQNRAVLLALGAAGGHPSLLSLAGMPAAVEPARGLGESLGLTLHGRNDWARHFLLSAGLTQVGEGGLTAGAGLLKERLDAAPGGTGFSFTDLLMDTAGARFGAAATEDESAARALQARLAEGVTDADLAPSPTGIADLTPPAGAEAGGPPAAELLAMEREIARRVDALRLYRPAEPPDSVR